MKNSEPADQHFFASTFYEWQVDDDIAEIIRRMQRNGQPFNLWLVPEPITAAYEIRGYTPMVEGARYLGHFDLKK
jgi:hypothetical protein